MSSLESRGAKCLLLPEFYRNILTGVKFSMFVDCLKMSGNLDDIRVFKEKSDGVEVILKIDGVIVPNIEVPMALFEELDKGSRYELYGIYKKSKDKTKNKGIIYAIKPQDGNMRTVTKLRFGVPLMISVSAAIAAVMAYVLTWVVAILPMSKNAPSISEAFVDIHHLALWIGALPIVFFALCAWNFLRKTGNLEEWPTTAPSVVVERFSKLHK
ncbi:hypothetical protein [Pseudomonas phoenicis]|uniref:hypothetical protein n=1 Tax=unclassified Pseudomonas TaxID=196821 RepID=UPI0039A2DE11